MQSLTIIGSTEVIDLPAYGVFGVPAKTDTGADTSSIWATDIVVHEDVLSFKLFGRSSKFYTGEKIMVKKGGFTTTTIINSFGHKEDRYKVKIPIVVCGRKVRASMTLADRENNTYPVLLGRSLLTNKFVVDVRHRPIDLKEHKEK